MIDNREETVWLTRSISLPVAECLSRPWPEFMRVLHGAWRESTDLANWASQTLARLDVSRVPGMTELPPLAKVDLYALAFGRPQEKLGRLFFQCAACPKKFSPSQLTEGQAPKHGTRRGGVCGGSGRVATELPRASLPPVDAQYGGDGWEGAKVAAATLLRWVENHYRKDRGKVIWRRERRTREYLYPVPFPVHQQAWEVWFENGKPVIAVQLPQGRVSLRLRNGPEFAPMVAVLKKIEAGELAKCELKICRERSYAAHRAQGSERGAGGGHRNSYRVMVRISYRYEAPANRDGIMATCHTGHDPFLRVVIPGRQEWLLHAPWVQHWIAEHRRFLDSFADDLKFEKRWPARKRKNLNRYCERRCDKHARRMRSFLQQTAAQVVGFAQRKGASALEFIDTDRSFAEEFPWFLLANRLSQKCEEAGLKFVAAQIGAVAVVAEPVSTMPPAIRGNRFGQQVLIARRLNARAAILVAAFRHRQAGRKDCFRVRHAAIGKRLDIRERLWIDRESVLQVVDRIRRGPEQQLKALTRPRLDRKRTNRRQLRGASLPGPRLPQVANACFERDRDAMISRAARDKRQVAIHAAILGRQFVLPDAADRGKRGKRLQKTPVIRAIKQAQAALDDRIHFKLLIARHGVIVAPKTAVVPHLGLKIDQRQR